MPDHDSPATPDPRPPSDSAGAAPDALGPDLVDRRAQRSRRRRTWIGGGLAALLVVGGAVAFVSSRAGGEAVASAGDSQSSGAASSGAGAAVDTSATVTVGLTLEPGNLDVRTTAGVALDQVLIDNVYEGLVSRTPEGTIAPSLATSWTTSEDALTYTFTLAPGESFSNGDPLTAATAADSINQAISTKAIDAESLGDVASVTAPDDTTVVVTLATPNPNLLWALAGRAGLVLDPKATNDLKTSAVGSGPYLLGGWKQGDSITLTRNDRYWGEPAKVASVVFRYIPDTNAALNALNSGDLDVLAPISADLRPKVTDPSTRLVEGDATDKFVLAFNNASGPLTDLRVRQAVRYAIDHRALVDALLGGPIAPGDPGYRDLTDLYPHDVAKAKELLAAAGHAEGLTLHLTIPTIYGTTFPDLLTSQLAQAGITLKTDSVDFSTWLTDVYTNKDYDLSIVDHAESRDFGAWANPDYYFGYDNAKVQDLWAKASVATSDEEADGLLAQAAEIVSKDAAADWLTNFRTVTAVRKGIEGFPTDQINSRLDLTGLSVTR